MLRRAADGQQLLNTALPFGANLPRNIDPILHEADEAAASRRDTVVSQLYKGVTTGRQSIAIVLPVAANNQNLTLAIAIPPAFIEHTIQSAQTSGQFALISLLDANHRIIARTRESEAYEGKIPPAEFLNRLTGPSGSFTATTMDGEDVFTTFYRSPTTGWVITASIPVAQYYRPVKEAAIGISVAFILALLSAFAAARLYRSYIVPPLLRLRSDALSLADRSAIEPFQTGISELSEVSGALAQTSATLIRDDQSKTTLINELNHRVKNTLASVLTIARQTVRRSKSLAEFGSNFEGRLIALSKSHDALSKSGWVDASMPHIVDEVTRAACGSGLKVSAGPDIALTPRAALTFGLIIHELCVNAGKYGALSTPSGSVDLSWRIVHDILQLAWVERGGPAANGSNHVGFGTRYITESLKHELSGTCEFLFEPAGLTFLATIPLSVITPSRSGPRRA